MIDLKTKKRIILVLVVAIVTTLFVYVQFVSANDYAFRSVAVTSSQIPKAFDGFRIAVISDVHLKEEDDIVRLQTIIEELNGKECQMILFAGDLYEEKPFAKTRVGELLKTINSSYGKFAVLGDEDQKHESDATKVLTEGGFEVLNDEMRKIYYKDKKIGLYGMAPDAKKASISKGYKYAIALAHYPDQFTITQKKVQLQISGHSGGGYIYLPGIGSLVKVDHAKTYNHGTYTTEKSQLIISNGIAPASHHHYKLFAGNEILLISLYTSSTK